MKAAINKTDKVKVSLTLNADVYGLLEEMCRKEVRHISRQISWLICQYAAKQRPAPGKAIKAGDVMRDGNIIYFPARKISEAV
jgi:hypothetical protein